MGLFFSCKDATKHAIMAEDTSLSRFDAIKLAIHMKLCKMCREYARQSALISRAMKLEGPELKLDSGFKEKLDKLISEQQA